MSISEHPRHISLVDEIERAARHLPAGDETATVFLEERSTLRLTLDSDGERSLSTSRSRGVAVGGAHSRHLSDPGPGRIEALAAGRLGSLEIIDAETGADAAGGGEATLRAEAPPRPEWVTAVEEELGRRLRHEAAGVSGAIWVAELTASWQNVWVATSDGSAQEDARWTGRIEVRAGFDGHPNSTCVSDLVWDGSSPADVTGFLASTLARADKRRGVLSRPPVGPTSAIFEAGLGGIVVHELVGHALEGDVEARELTWLARLAHSTGPRRLTVVDDPSIGRATWKTDDEGAVAQRVTLIEDGRPVGALLDRRSALVLGRPSNGHGRRSTYLDPPLPRMGCTFISTGTDDPDEIERETKSAVVIRRMTAGHADPERGRATFVVTEADLIANGRRVTPLTAFLIEIDGAEALPSIDRVGTDLVFDRCIGSCVREGQPLAVSVGAPTIRIGVINVVA